MNVYFSESTKRVVWSDGKHAILTQLDENTGKTKQLAKEPVTEETMLTLSHCAKVTDWVRRDSINFFSHL